MSTKSSSAAANTKAPLSRTGSNENNNAIDKKQQQIKYIASVVRALVNSRKPPCTLREILREYPEVENKPIPFKQLGFNSSEDLLRESGEFIFNRIGGETCITAKHNTKTAHIASMVRSQKSSKSTRITQVKQVRQPQRSDQSWNKSTFSSNIFQKLPPASHRFIESQNRANKLNNNNNNYQNNNRNNNKSNNAQQQQLQRQKSVGGSGGGSNNNNNNKINSAAAAQQPKDLREVINAKVQQSNNNSKDNNNHNNKNVANGQKDLRSLLNQKSQDQQKAQQQKMQNGNKVDLRERLNSKLQQEQNQNSNMPRAILGQNNGISGANATANQQKQQHQQLLQNNTAIAIASSLILAQREQKNQEQRQQNRADLLSYQQQQQQQQQQHQQQRSAYKQSSQHQQQQQQQQQLTPAAAAAAKYKNNAASISAITNGIANCSVQQRLSVRINNSNNNTNTNNDRTAFISSGNSADSSPAPSSAGSDQLQQSPFSGPQTAQFNKQRFIQQKQQHQVEEEPVIPPKVFQFNPHLDPITSLSQYCLVRKCAKPEYTIFKPKFSNLFQGRVFVNGNMYSTYPKEYLNEHMTKIACACQAIEQIKAHEYRRPLPPCTDTDYELTEKIYNELLEHPHGMFAKNITEWFETTYKQALPAHWWSLVQSSNKFITETAASNNVILFANMDFDKDDAESLSDLSINTVIKMEGITLPWSQKCWNLYITHCASTIEVWARLFGNDYSEKFDNLMNEIEISMLNEKVRPLAISNKQIYLVCISDCWHRVRVEEMDKLNGTALCFFIDFGDADWLSVSQLYICDPKFLTLPSQAVPFSLFGLEDFAGNPYARRNLDVLLASKSVVGEILTKEADFYSSDAAKVQVVLYDTSSQDDINLHPLILNAICDDTPPPKLNQTGVTNVQVSYVSDDGDLYLQILNSELKYVQKLVQQLIESKFKRDQHKVTRDDLKRSNLFLICEESNGDDAQPLWYRGALTERHYLPDDEEFDIFYVDNGQTRRTHISKIFRLESLSTALSKFPRQAIKVRLHNIPNINKSIVGRMRALLPANCEALVKMVTPNTVPYITAYRRIGGSDTLSTINDVIRIEHELEISSDAADGSGGSTTPSDTTIIATGGSTASNASLSPRTNSFVDVTRGLTITCATSVPNSPQKSGELPKLKTYDAIPPIGDFFEVRVTMSSNPSNFTIQPYKSYPKLRTMMKDLQEYCENNDDFIPVDMVEIGQAYAAKNPDGYYHRVTVVNTYSGEMIHVCFCDFGDIAILRSDQLKILPAKFRVLPKMAIQAKLHGISARHVDWTLDDCLRFRELTVGLKFVSIIQRISHDKLGTPDAQILELDLVDVTTDEDVYIHELLLKEERAIVDDAVKKVAVH